MNVKKPAGVLALGLLIMGGAQALPAQFIEFIENGVNGAEGIENTDEIVLSPDEKFIYTCSLIDDAVTVLQRNADSGRLNQIQVLVDDENGVDGLDFCQGIAITSSGSHVYTVSGGEIGDDFGTDGVAIFSRNATTGMLTFISFFNAEDEAPKDTFGNPNDIIVSPDDNHVYVTDNARHISIMSRSPNGSLSYIEEFNMSPNGLAQQMFFSADGSYLYGVAPTGGSAPAEFTVLQRTAASGLLQVTQSFSRSTTGFTDVENIADGVISNDGSYLYLSGNGGTFSFSRNSSNGQVALIGSVKTIPRRNGDSSVHRAKNIALSPNNKLLYAGDGISRRIVVFTRENNGSLSYFGQLVENEGGARGLDGVTEVEVSSDGAFLYQSLSNNDDGVSVFDLRTDLSVAITDNPGTVTPAGALRYLVDVTNISGVDASRVQVTINVPTGATVNNTSVAPSGSCSQAGQVLSCEVGNLIEANNAVVTIDMTAPATEGNISLSASAEADQVDKDVSNNSRSETTTVAASGSGSGQPDPVDPDPVDPNPTDPESDAAEESSGGGAAIFLALLALIGCRSRSRVTAPLR